MTMTIKCCAGLAHLFVEGRAVAWTHARPIRPVVVRQQILVLEHQVMGPLVGVCLRTGDETVRQFDPTLNVHIGEGWGRHVGAL